MENITLKAEKREITGKKTKQLRREGVIPAVIAEADEQSINVQVNLKEFQKIFTKAGHSTLVNVEYAGKAFKAIIEEVQFSPKTRFAMHAILNKVNLKEEIHAEVPLELVGEAPAVKIEKAVLVTPIDTIEVKCLPTDLPAKIDVDISKLNVIGDSITLADVKLPKGVKIVREDDLENIVVTATAPQKEEEVTETTEVTPDQVELSVEKGKKDKEENA